MTRSPIRSRLTILSAAALWSTAGAAIKLCGLNAWQIAGGRSLVAGAMLFAFVPGTRTRPDRKVLGVGAAYAGTVLLFVVANKLTTAANAIFIQDTAPLYVLLLSPFLLREKATRSELLSVPLYAIGIIMFFMDQLSPGQLRGNLIALVSGVTFALSIMGLRHLREGRGDAAAAWGNAMAFVVALPLAASGPHVTFRDLGLIAYLGVFQLGLAYLLFARGLEHTSAVEASLLVLLEPVLNPVWTFAFAGERPGPWAICGGGVVLTATLWQTFHPAQQLPKPVVVD
jgi:drug/metabolite transporter, DME family